MRLTTSACVALVWIVCARAAATTYTFQQPVGDWATASNWSPSGGPPTYGDRAVIPTGKNCSINDTANADTIEVASGATLNVNAFFFLWNDYYGVHTSRVDSLINGDVWVNDDDVTHGELWFVGADHKLTGTGKIEGYAAASMYIDSVQVVNQLATSGKGIRGSFIIYGNSTQG